MQKHHRFSIWYVILAIWGVLLIHNLLVSAFAIETIPYSQFLRLLKEQKITEVAISENQIEGRMVPADGVEGRTVMFRTVRVDPEISELLEEHNVTFKGQIESTFLRDILSWVIPVALFIGIWLYMIKRMQGQQGFMTIGKNKAKIYVEDEVGVTFEDAAGVEEAKQELVEVIDFLKKPERFISIGGKMPRGILLVGPPGTGKTLLARAVAGESGVPFFSMSGSEFVEMFVGMGAARVRDLFTQAKQKAPCIIFIDELDALGKARGFGGAMGGHDEREQTLNQLLVEMDGFDAQVGVILMAATNRPEILDPALLRPGRFDRQVLVDRPDKNGREAILKVHLKQVHIEEGLDVEKIAAMTPGMVGADLANLVNEAALLAVRRGKKNVGMEDFEEAVERLVAGLEKKNRLINPEEKKIVAYHEVGHAIVAMALPGTDPVRKITIIPRGIAALGYTMQVPTEDRFLMRKTELLNKIATLLGGRAAEEIVFDDISTGAHNDLAKATDIARSMVKQYGMSETIGQVYHASAQRSPFLHPGMDGHAEYSQATAEMIDNEVRETINTQYLAAKRILEEKRELLEASTRKLLEQETIAGEELKALADKIQGG
jgi:cell division protease FtsH